MTAFPFHPLDSTAALFLAVTRTPLRVVAVGSDPAQCLSTVNALLAADHAARTCSLLCSAR